MADESLLFAQINEKGPHETILHAVIAKAKTDFIIWLFEQGANPYAYGKDTYTSESLISAVRSSQSDNNEATDFMMELLDTHKPSAHTLRRILSTLKENFSQRYKGRERLLALIIPLCTRLQKYCLPTQDHDTTVL